MLKLLEISCQLAKFLNVLNKQDNCILEAHGSDLPGSHFIWSLHALDQCVLAEVLISVCV